MFREPKMDVNKQRKDLIQKGSGKVAGDKGCLLT